MVKLYEPGSSVGNNGIYISEYEINKVEVNDSFNTDKLFNYIFYVQKKDADYEKMFFLTGNPDKNDNLPPNISFLLYALNIQDYANADKLLDFNDIEIMNDFCNGKSIKLLSYVSGVWGEEDKPNYKFWNGIQKEYNSKLNVFSTETDSKDIMEAFKLTLDSTYAPKYTPEVLVEKTNVVNTEKEDKGDFEDDIM